MRLLVVTQKVDIDDDLLGFFHEWLISLAGRCDSLLVVCLEEGKHHLPKNVSVYSLGKERVLPSGSVFQRVIQKFLYAWTFVRFIIRLRAKYDKVFVHMNPEYVMLGGLFWRLWGKRIGFSYVHRAVTYKLKLAARLAHVIFSSSMYSFRVTTSKLVLFGHGINTKRFSCAHIQPSNVVRILSVGRISPIKCCETLIEAVSILHNSWEKKFEVRFLGSPSDRDSDRTYAKELDQLVSRLGLSGIVFFDGSVSNLTIPQHYCSADLTVNMAPDGGMDKAVLESMASSRIPIVSNRSFEPYLKPYASELLFQYGDAKDLAFKIKNLFDRSDMLKITNDLRSTVEREFSIERVTATIVSNL